MFTTIVKLTIDFSNDVFSSLSRIHLLATRGSGWLWAASREVVLILILAYGCAIIFQNADLLFRSFRFCDVLAVSTFYENIEMLNPFTP